MEHRMKLKNKPFELIKSGKKKQELRLYDEKRKLIEVGDTIIFTNIDTNEELKVEVMYIHLYSNFKDLYNDFNKQELGYEENEKYSYKDMYEYYSKEEQEKYGVVALEIQQKNYKWCLFYNLSMIKLYC